MESTSSPLSSLHVVLFPFMAKGHTIPLLQLARLLLRRPYTHITVFTTPTNQSFIAHSLTDTTTASVIVLPFPENIPEIPAGIESTDKLPSMSLHVPFCEATKFIQPAFEKALQTLPPVSFMISDGFLWWTLESALKFGFPRFVFYGLNNYAVTVSRIVRDNQLLFGVESDNELIPLTHFPWINISRDDFEPNVKDGERNDVFMKQVSESTTKSHGLIVNSFYELESPFVDYLTMEGKSKPWCVGPLCLADSQLGVEIQPADHKPSWIQWLDQRSSVIYVAFGTQAEISNEQLKQIAIGLEESKVNFLWVIRNGEIGDGFEERVKGRGIVVRDWVNQWEILMHDSVKGFLSHCGWNSVLESICAGVPILAMPMMAEQHLNAKMVVEEIKVGLRVETCNGSARGFVKWEGLEKSVRELMEGEMGKEVRKKVKELAEMAKQAIEEGKGSSWRTLDMLIVEACNLQQKNFNS